MSVAVADFVKGKRVAWRYLHRSVTESWLKLVLTVTGTDTAGKVFCAIVREDDEPYEAGQYVNKGVVVG